MDIFSLLTMFGGLAMFLYGMRLMSGGLRESSSGQLKLLMEAVTNNPFKAFLLGVAVTALIQSSTATIVITSGLVAAGIITLKQSLGIVVGANIGTTVTGQIIRLMDIDSSSGAFLQLFKPSTLAPIALIAGIVIIMGFNFKNAKAIGNITIGFGILFTGLMTMTNAVDALNETGIFQSLLTGFGTNPFLGYLAGATVAFILQSSSAAVGILQALSASGSLTFAGIYAVIVGIYLGDCLTTGIVCWIDAKADQKRVGVFNILFNGVKSIIVLVGVFVLKQMGVLDSLWNTAVNSGVIANTNTIFNIVPALLFFPVLNACEALSRKIVKDDAVEENIKYQEKLEALSPAFYQTPALALRSCYDLLSTMFDLSRENIENALSTVKDYDQTVVDGVLENEEYIDMFADRLSEYLGSLSGKLTDNSHVSILNQYLKVVTEFERLGDHAMNILGVARDMDEKSVQFSDVASDELQILVQLIIDVLNLADLTFKQRDLDAAYAIEPLEQVVDNVVEELKEKHLSRLANGECNVFAGVDYMDVLSDLERISDICSNIGLATVQRVEPEHMHLLADYINSVHTIHSDRFDQDYQEAHDRVFKELSDIQDKHSNT